MDRNPGRKYVFRCDHCGTVLPNFGYECASCAGVVVVDPEPLSRPAPVPANHSGIWRYKWLLPETTEAVTLGEGATSIVELGRQIIGPYRVPVIVKLESQNPTLSFKDRAMALGVSHAMELGLKGLVVASTGNAAVSAAAYAAAAGLDCRVLVASASDAARKLDACRAFGAQVTVVPGDYSQAYSKAQTLEGEGWMNVSTTYRNPLLAEAYRTVAFELIEQLGTAPNAVVVPLGAGPLLRGIQQGFADAVSVGNAGSLPQLVGVQATAVSPLVHAWQNGRWAQSLMEPLRHRVTVATAIADPLRGYQRQGLLTLEAVKRSGGTVLGVEEDQILTAHARLLQHGIWAEPSAATGVAALEQLDGKWWAQRFGPVVVMVTGHGIKAPLPAG